MDGRARLEEPAAWQDSRHLDAYSGWLSSRLGLDERLPERRHSPDLLVLWEARTGGTV